MGWKKLSTDYKDISWNGLKRYTQIENDDGTISFRDDTKYINKDSSFFGAKDANRINEAMNYIMEKLEKGTDLYDEFKEFFDIQKQKFIEAKDEKFAEIKQATDTDYSNFGQYLEELRRKGNTALSTVETDHRQRMGTYETTQKALFNQWFLELKGHLSNDAAGRLQIQIDDLKDLIDGFVTKNIEFSEDGNTVVETMGDKKLITEFISDLEIVKKLYVKEVLRLTKKTFFSEDGKTIREVIINELG